MLITLGIIGIVAALTLPVIAENIQKKVLKNQFKVAYSILTNAFNKAMFDNEPLCYYGQSGEPSQNSQCSALFNTFLPAELKIARVCKGNALEQGCIPQYSSSIYREESGCSGFSEENITKKKNVYVLTNGVIIIPYGGGSTPLFMIDVNGHKKPNKKGYDIFSFDILQNPTTKNVYLKYKYGGCFFADTGGAKSIEEINNW